MTTDYSELAIKAVTEAEIAYCKFIMPNDTTATGAHQSGYHIHKNAYKMIFSKPSVRGKNKDKWVTIKWQDDFETTSRFIYYGQGTRNEYRLTNFGRGFPFTDDDDVGSLLILCRIEDEYYVAYVLSTEEEINNFLAYFSISPAQANGIIEQLISVPEDVGTIIERYITAMEPGFPKSETISTSARQIAQQLNGRGDADVVRDPDTEIVAWTDIEYKLFQAIEKDRYKELLSPYSFTEVSHLVEAANTILNRRKSRAGMSLEHHLAKTFDVNELPYSSQKITEGKKKPDFIIPSIELYRDQHYQEDKLVFLGAKTTCKDRWRQILNEAARIPKKHLFTLQQGISSSQLKEMKEEGVTLVVPKQHLTMFPSEHRGDIVSLKEFIDYSKGKIR